MTILNGKDCDVVARGLSLICEVVWSERVSKVVPLRVQNKVTWAYKNARFLQKLGDIHGNL